MFLRSPVKRPEELDEKFDPLLVAHESGALHAPVLVDTEVEVLSKRLEIPVELEVPKVSHQVHLIPRLEPLVHRVEEMPVLVTGNLAGGRARGFRRDGYVFDLGAQFSADLCTTTFRLCRELGMGSDIMGFDMVGGIWRNGRLSPVPISRSPRDIWRHRSDLLRFRGLPWKAYPQMARIALYLARRYSDFDFDSMDPEPVLDLSDISIADFALRYGGREALDYVFQPMTASLTLGEPDQVGAAHILGLLMGLLPGLKFLEKGIGSLPEALYNNCSDSIRLEAAVNKIVIDGATVRGVETDESFIEAESVICTTTATTALNLAPGLPDTLRRPLEKVAYSSTVHFIFALRERLLPEGWYALTFSHREGSIHPGLADAGGKSPYFAPPGAGLPAVPDSIVIYSQYYAIITT